MKQPPENDFARAAHESNHRGPIAGMFRMLMENKKWWLIPVVVMLMLLGILVFLSSSAAAPFIYTLF